MLDITPYSEHGTQHRKVCEAMFTGTMRAEDTQIRLERLREECRRRGIDPDSPSAVRSVLGKSTSFWSDLMNGRKSFGEKLARELEQQMHLPRNALDMVMSGHPRSMAELNGFEGQAVTLMRMLSVEDQHNFLRALQAAVDEARQSPPSSISPPPPRNSRPATPKDDVT